MDRETKPKQEQTFEGQQENVVYYICGGKFFGNLPKHYI
jgi:hypothetical protein